MSLDRLLSTIILVSFLITIVLAVGSYAAYKLRERRRPRAAAGDAEGAGASTLARVTAAEWDDAAARAPERPRVEGPRA